MTYGYIDPFVDEDQMNRSDTLEQAIRRHRDLYYAGEPEISDDTFDALVEELEALSPASVVLSEIGAPVSSPLAKVKHQIPMGSLSKTKVENVETWMASTGANRFLIQEKYDGISVALYYENGRLIRAVTRGDGSEGEDVTHNVQNYDGALSEIPGFTGSIRGEAILPKPVFEEKFAKDYANPRNTTAGFTRRKEALPVEIAKCFKLYFYDVIDEAAEFESESQKIEWLSEHGLRPAANYAIEPPLSFEDLWEDYLSMREKLEVEIDGLVLKVDFVVIQENLPAVGNRPGWATAVKFANKGAETTLEAIDWQLGTGGRITPVARLTPVKVAGVTVSNATLHNEEYARTLGAMIGDRVLVERAGDVIPQVVYVVEKALLANSTAYFPTECPACGDEPTKDGKFWVCTNLFCKGKFVGALQKWITEVEIEGIGDSWVRVLVDRGVVKTPDDLYRLTKEDLLDIEGIQEKKAQNFLAEIEKSKTPSLPAFLAGLNIPQFSRTRAQSLLDAGFRTLDAVLAITEEQLASIDRLGDILAQAIVRGLEIRTPLARELVSVGVNPQVPEQASASLDGKSFCFTGSVAEVNPETGKKYTRPQLQDIVRSNGGVVKSSVSKGLDYLVIADPSSTSSKAKKARDLGTSLISPADFLDLVR